MRVSDTETQDTNWRRHSPGLARAGPALVVATAWAVTSVACMPLRPPGEGIPAGRAIGTAVSPVRPLTMSDSLSSDRLVGPLGARLDTLLTHAVPYGFSGVVLAARDGEVVLNRAYGYADRDRRVPMATGAVFPISSLVKVFTAAAVRDLVRDGKLSLTDSIHQFFPTVPPDKRGIMVQHLLRHTAGLHPYLGDDAEDFDLIPRDTMLHRVLTRPLRSPPGTRTSYSNPGYVLLAAIIEATSQEPFDTFVQRRLFRPAGMIHTGSRPLSARDSSLTVQGYRGLTDQGNQIGKPMAPDGPSWSVRGSGGMFSTAGDLYRWIRAQEAIGEASDGVFAGSDRTHYAAINRRGDVLGILLSNARNDPDGVSRDEPALAIAELLDDVLLGREVRFPPAPASVAPPLLARLAGVYVAPSGAAFEIRAGDGHLLVLDPRRALGRVLAPITQPNGDAQYRRREVRIAQVFRELGNDSITSVIQSLPPGIDPAQEAVYWQSTLPAWRNLYGRFSTSEVLGTVAKGDTTDMLVLLRFERAERLVRVRIDREDRLLIDTSTRFDLTSSYRLVPISDTTYVAYDFLTGRRASVRFLFDPNGRVVGLRSEEAPSAGVFRRRD